MHQPLIRECALFIQQCDTVYCLDSCEIQQASYIFIVALLFIISIYDVLLFIISIYDVLLFIISIYDVLLFIISIYDVLLFIISIYKLLIHKFL